MYKCGWNGCEKAYGTLNHLNAHVTMQSHGVKRTPEGMLSRPSPSLVKEMPWCTPDGGLSLAKCPCSRVS
jgi:hypothetical protein